MRAKLISFWLAAYLVLPGLIRAESSASGFPLSEAHAEVSGAGQAAAPTAEVRVDEQGRRYREEPISKREAQRVAPDVVRTVWGGIPIDVIREDDSNYYFKHYIVEEAAPSPPRATPAARITTRVIPPEAGGLRLQPFDEGLPKAGEWREGFGVADMNGDGFADVVAPPARKSMTPPMIFLGDGKGRWRPWKEVAYPTLAFDYGDAAAGDFDGDGVQDLALAIHLRGILALKGDGKGGFQSWSRGLDFANTNGEMDKAYPSRSLLILDWNRDGRPDIVAQGEGPMLAGGGEAGAARPGRGLIIYLNQGGGQWTRAGGPASDLFGNGLASGDFDGNGRPDLLMSSSVIGREDLLAMGQEGGAWAPARLAGLPGRSFIRAVATADFNRDGRDDMALSWLSFATDDWRSGLDILLADTRGGWIHKTVLADAGTDVINGMAAGDVDGDGLIDLAGVGESGRLWLLRGRPDGSLVGERAARALSLPHCRGSAVRLADLDRDGRADIVAMFGQEPTDPARGCPDSGSLRAWRVVRDTPAPARKGARRGK